MLSSNLTAADRDMPLTPPLPAVRGQGWGDACFAISPAWSWF